MELEHIELGVTITHHINPAPLRINGDAFGFAHPPGFTAVVEQQIQTLQHPIAGPVVVEQTPPLVAGDPDRVALAVVTQP